MLLPQVVVVPNRGIWGTAGIGGANLDMHLHDKSSGPPQQVRHLTALKYGMFVCCPLTAMSTTLDTHLHDKGSGRPQQVIYMTVVGFEFVLCYYRLIVAVVTPLDMHLHDKSSGPPQQVILSAVAGV
jgi:hypothetical protein